MILNTIFLHYKAGPINMIWLVLSVFDWSIIMIRPGGLLLVVPTYLQSQFQFYWWVAKKKTKLNLDVRNTFARSHTQHWWGCKLECQGELVGKALESNIYFHGSIFLALFMGYHRASALSQKQRPHPLALLSRCIQIMPSSAIVKVSA
jgi:hypothetical protein